MKSKSIAINLLLASAVGAVRVKDIFDAYDQESNLEQLKHEDSIDPAALAAEIGGDDIARDVMSATGGIVDQTMLQLDAEVDLGRSRKVHHHHPHHLAVAEE